ncbi:toprim domain-containing protein [Vibrio alginolyticus]
MNLILVESSLKSKQVNLALGALGIQEEFTCGFTMGRVFDFKVGDPSLKWSPRNSDVYQYLSTQIQRSDNVIAMTDADEQGEYIAYQLQTIANQYGRSLVKADLSELSPLGIKTALSKVRPINLDVVAQAHTERLLNLKVANYGINQGIGPTSIHKLMVASHLMDTPTLNVATFLDDESSVKALTYNTSLKSAESELVEVPTKPPSTLNIYQNVAIHYDTPVCDIANNLQDLYQSGKLSYGRVTENYWYPSAENSVEDTLSELCVAIDMERFAALTERNQAHSAIYVVDHRSVYSKHSEVEMVTEFTKSALGLSDKKTYLADAGGPILSTEELVQSGLKRSSPDIQILQSLNELGLYKPSTSPTLCSSLSSAFYINSQLNKEALKFQFSITKRLFPSLLEHIEMRQNPITQQVNHNVDGTELTITNNMANTLFDNLTMSR